MLRDLVDWRSQMRRTERGLGVSRRSIIFYHLFGVGFGTKACSLVGMTDGSIVSWKVVGWVDETEEDQQN